jgi:hypothetical protein
VKRRSEWKELELLMHRVRSEGSQPQKTGFLGLGGMKKEDYYTFTDKLNLVESNLEAMAEDWDQYLVKKAEELGDILDAYREASREAGQKCQEALALDGYEPPEKEELDKILLGEVSVGLKGLTEKGKKTDAHAPGHGQ